MQGLRSSLSGEYLLVFMFCMAVIIGPVIITFFQFDLTYFPDCKTYLGLAHFDFNQNPVRRYRVIIPFSAAAINFLSGGVFARFAPSYFKGDYSLVFSFFLINTVLTAYFGLLIYRYCKAFGVNKTSAIIGALAMLTCRYTVYMAAFPLVDSLFCVIIALTLLGLKLKNTNMLLWVIFLGPFVKESFIFIAPLIFFFSHLDKKRLFFYFLVAGISVFLFRYLFDKYILVSVGSGLEADLSHLPNLIRNLPKLFSVPTLFKILMNLGLWVLVPFLALFIKPGWGRVLLKALDKYLIYFMISVLLQMLLSGSMERMFYLAMPVFCVVVALSVDELGKLYKSALK